jgi:response regulator NasT
VVDDKRDRADMICEALQASGHTVAGRLRGGADLPARVKEWQADAVVVDIASPDPDTLQGLRDVSFRQERPVVIFADDGKRETITAAIDAGAAAYVVDGFEPDRVKSVLDVAVARFAHVRALRGELVEAKASLAERKRIERAKGILMKRRRCDEDEAFRQMRKMAMDQKLRLVEVAEKIIEAAALLG